MGISQEQKESLPTPTFLFLPSYPILLPQPSYFNTLILALFLQSSIPGLLGLKTPEYLEGRKKLYIAEKEKKNFCLRTIINDGQKNNLPCLFPLLTSHHLK